MNSRPIFRWVTILSAIPVGWVIGFACGYLLGAFMLQAQGRGNSFNDLNTLLGAGGLGAVFGALLVPWFVWFYWRRQKGPSNGPKNTS
jgi:hypothetical protein